MMQSYQGMYQIFFHHTSTGNDQTYRVSGLKDGDQDEDLL